jgi:hypothetical protein
MTGRCASLLPATFGCGAVPRSEITYALPALMMVAAIPNRPLRGSIGKRGCLASGAFANLAARSVALPAESMRRDVHQHGVFGPLGTRIRTVVELWKIRHKAGLELGCSMSSRSGLDALILIHGTPTSFFRLYVS